MGGCHTVVDVGVPHGLRFDGRFGVLNIRKG